VAWRSRDPRARSYRIVVVGSACDAASWTSRRGTPASRAAVMNACRNVCGVTRLLIQQLTQAGGSARRWDRMRYEYRTEGVYLEEKFLGRTSAASDMSSIAAQLNKAAAQGWELLQLAKVDVVGKVFKSSERRDVAVAVYRRPVE